MFATCKFKPDGDKTYDYLVPDELAVDVQLDSLVLVESDYAPFGLTVVKVVEVSDRNNPRAQKPIRQVVKEF